MGEEYTIAAVVVTFNRKELLLKNINASFKQKRKLNRIIIIDNHSTDGTKEYVYSNLDKNCQKEIDYVYLKENVGGSGGFSYGVQYAYEHGYDYLWLMDDDGRPWNEDTLLNLVSYIDDNRLYNQPIMLNSLVQCDDNNLSFGEVQDGRIIYKKEEIKYKELKGHCSLFNGTLISKELVQKIGFPRNDYFIKGDEKEYFARTLKNNIFNSTIVNSLYFHPSPIRWNDLRVILGKRLFNNIEPGWKEYYNMRNVCLNNKMYERKYSWINFRFYLIRCFKIILFGDKKLYLLKMITTAYSHANKGYTGKYILPNGQKNTEWEKTTI